MLTRAGQEPLMGYKEGRACLVTTSRSTLYADLVIWLVLTPPPLPFIDEGTRVWSHLKHLEFLASTPDSGFLNTSWSDLKRQILVHSD